LPIKKSINILGHKTSISIEKEFWKVLKVFSEEENRSISSIISEIDLIKPNNKSLSSSIRVYIIKRLLKNTSIKK